MLDYPAVVFVAHSMGGLVVLRELLTHREDLLPRVRGLVFYATPQEGSQITRIAGHVARNPAIAEMLPGDQNLSLQQLDNEWKALPARPTVRCAYEKRPTAQRHGRAGDERDALLRRHAGGHRRRPRHIVKPDRASHDTMMVLVNALNEFALGAQLCAACSRRPTSSPNGDHLVFTMTDPFGRSTARLNNSGGSPLRYTDRTRPRIRRLFVWPDDTPRMLAAGGARAAALRPRLRSDGHRVPHHADLGRAARSRVVVVRVPNLEAMMAQQVRLAEGVSRDLGTLLGESGDERGFTAAAADDPAVPEAMTQRRARDSVARRTGDLPESATWVVAADLMDAGKLARPGDPRVAPRRSRPRRPPPARPPCSSWRASGGARRPDAHLHVGADRGGRRPVPERPQPFVDARAAVRHRSASRA